MTKKEYDKNYQKTHCNVCGQLLINNKCPECRAVQRELRRYGKQIRNKTIRRPPDLLEYYNVVW